MNLPNRNFFIDIELGYDFLTLEMSATLFILGSNKDLYPLGMTALVREEAVQDNAMSSISKKQVRRIRISNLDSIIDRNFNASNKMLLRIKFDKQLH